MPITFTLNGTLQTRLETISIAALLEELAIDPKTIVVEYNRQILEKDDLKNVFILNHDEIELIQFVGGG
ncbi:MAG: sulfur carrier protein ThiS [Desulfobacterales bacterium]|nr:sulfur carrier protein ThiS [Desulfobacterales bacterium]